MSQLLHHFIRKDGGVAAIEMALIGGLFFIGMMNATDVGRYAYEASEVNAAAQAGAQAALKACDVAHTPATINCPGLQSAVTTAIQTTPLAANLTIDGAITEGYYCLDAQNNLQLAGPAGSEPANCSGVANANPQAAPTLYLQVPVTYTFRPLFPNLTIAQTFAPAIKRTAWMRMA
jgi:Flp pilus assembly protein TadG